MERAIARKPQNVVRFRQRRNIAKHKLSRVKARHQFMRCLTWRIEVTSEEIKGNAHAPFIFQAAKVDFLDQELQ
jgi:hypothetical protein